MIDQAEHGLYETAVCALHAAALKAGGSYVYNRVENVVYMDKDASIQDE